MYDKNFIDIIKIINQVSGFKYWISYGSLLGIIRDGKLIEWDEDVDICVREDQVCFDKLEGICKQAKSLGFQVNKSQNNYQFTRQGGRKIDVNILLPKMVEGEMVLDLVWEIYFVQTTIHMKIISHLVRRIDSWMLDFLLPIWRSITSYFGLYGQLRYRTKLKWVEKTFKYKYGSETIFLPCEYEQILNNIYGANWKVPKKSIIWHEFGKKND